MPGRLRLVGILALLVPAAPAQAQSDKDEFHWQRALAAGKTIEIVGVNGAIEAEGSPGREVEVSAVKKGRRSDPATVTFNVVEHPDLVADRIVRFAKLVGRENVIAGTDCGLGGRVHPQIAWAKLASLAQGAELATRQLG